MPPVMLTWDDVQQRFTATLTLADDGGHTLVTLKPAAPWLALRLEGLRGLPGQALALLHDLCQTAATL
ncbi:MAG: hypothetical protein ABR583_11570 [Gaiellaceae bacterium]